MHPKKSSEEVRVTCESNFEKHIPGTHIFFCKSITLQAHFKNNNLTEPN